MRPLSTAIVSFFLLLGALFDESADASTIILDSFLEEFDLSGAAGQESQFEEITSEVAAWRWASGSGFGTWFAIVEPGSGQMQYHTGFRGGLPGVDLFALAYEGQPGELLDLLGFNAFRLTIVDSVGSGFLQVAVNGRNHTSSVAVPINSSGELFYGFSGIDGFDPSAPSATIFNVDFRIIAETPDFAVTISEIAVVPEPNLHVLAGIVIVFNLLAHRRRTQ